MGLGGFGYSLKNKKNSRDFVYDFNETSALIENYDDVDEHFSSFFWGNKKRGLITIEK